jgi:uncharacterized protein
MKWYEKGLYFGCKKCSNCCTGSPGYVWLDKDEIESISKYLKITKKEFLKKYTRSFKNKISLLENNANYDCIFLKDKKCSIYNSRPSQCRTYPFWKSCLKSKTSWEDQKKYCPGIDNTEGKFYSIEDIKNILF